MSGPIAAHTPALEDLGRVDSAHRRFLVAIATLSDAHVRRPSRLPEWTVGHVLTHVARNADSHCRRAKAAAQGEIVDQYAGGFAGRAAEIESGAGRRAEELIEDVRASAAALEATWRSLPDEAWGNDTRDVGGVTRSLSQLPSRRWQEIEVHLVDLDIGVTYRDWPDDFVSIWLPRLRQGLPGRLPERIGPPAFDDDFDERDELAWLYGRLQREDLPQLAPWR